MHCQPACITVLPRIAVPRPPRVHYGILHYTFDDTPGSGVVVVGGAGYAFTPHLFDIRVTLPVRILRDDENGLPIPRAFRAFGSTAVAWRRQFRSTFDPFGVATYPLRLLLPYGTVAFPARPFIPIALQCPTFPLVLGCPLLAARFGPFDVRFAGWLAHVYPHRATPLPICYLLDDIAGLLDPTRLTTPPPLPYPQV